MPAAASAASASSKPPSWAAVCGSSGSSATAQVGPHGLERSDGWASDRRRPSATASPGRHRRGACRCRPSGGRGRSARRPAPPSRPVHRGRRGVRRSAARSRGASRRRARSGVVRTAPGSGRRCRPARSATPSSTRATHEPVGARLERGPGHRHGTVAVAVGLHDRPHRGRGRPARRSTPTLCGDGAEVDLDPGPTPWIRRHRSERLPARRGAGRGRSPATRPRAGPALGRPAVQPGAGRGGLERPAPAARASAPMIPDSTSPVPAVASRSSPASTTRTVPAGVGDHRRRPLQQHHRAEAAASARAAPIRSRPGRCAGQQAELAVVGGEHRGGAIGPQHRAGAFGGPGQGEQPVAVDHDRALRRVATSCADLAAVVVVRARGPGRPRGRGTGRARRARPPPTPAEGSGWPTTSVGAPGRSARPASTSRTMPAPARCAAAVGQVGGADHAGRAGHHPPRPRATCARRRRGPGSQRRRRRSSTRWARPGSTSRPMSATSTSPARPRPGGNSRPGFSAANVTVRSAATAPSAGRAGEAVDAARDVDGQHRASPPVGSGPRRRGSRCRRRRRSPGRPRAARPGRSAASTITHAPRPGRPGAAPRPGRRSPLLPLPATTTTRRP